MENLLNCNEEDQALKHQCQTHLLDEKFKCALLSFSYHVLMQLEFFRLLKYPMNIFLSIKSNLKFRMLYIWIKEVI